MAKCKYCGEGMKTAEDLAREVFFSTVRSQEIDCLEHPAALIRADREAVRRDTISRIRQISYGTEVLGIHEYDIVDLEAIAEGGKG